MAAVWRDPETQALPVVAGVLVLTGTLFYWRFEDWTIIEALYFCVVALTTVGFGDFTPTSAGTQIFTIVYILTGFGVLVALAHFGRREVLGAKGRARRRATAAEGTSSRRPASRGGRPALELARRRLADLGHAK